MRHRRRTARQRCGPGHDPGAHGRRCLPGAAVLLFALLAPACLVDFDQPSGSSDADVSGPDAALPDGAPPVDAAPPRVDAIADAVVQVDAIADAVVQVDADPGCPPGTKDCEGGCVSLDSPATGCSAESCEPCGFDHGEALCVSGACALGTCENGWGNCDLQATTGCEADLTSDVSYCGSCSTSCAVPHATMSCVGSVCQFQGCDADYANCDGNVQSNGCEIGTAYDDDNCGHCGHVCPVSFNCNNTMCRCSSDPECDTGGGGTCDSYYKLCECPTQFCEGPCDTDGIGCL